MQLTLYDNFADNISVVRIYTICTFIFVPIYWLQNADSK